MRGQKTTVHDKLRALLVGNWIFRGLGREGLTDERQRGDGHGLARFRKAKRTITFECWPRFVDLRQGDAAQYPGWPLTVAMDANDGRKVHARLPAVRLDGVAEPVVQVIHEESGEILYTVRSVEASFTPRVYAPGTYTIKAGRDRPDTVVARGVRAT